MFQILICTDTMTANQDPIAFMFMTSFIIIIIIAVLVVFSYFILLLIDSVIFCYNVNHYQKKM